MIKKRLALGICVCACSFLLFGSMEASAFCYTATPSWSKSPLSSNVTFKATTVGGIESRGYYVFAFAALREQAGGSNLSSGGMQTSMVPPAAVSHAISSSATFDNNRAKYGYAEYGISCDKPGKQPVEGKHIAMEYGNIY